MKNASLFLATAITLLFGCQIALQAQKTATWKGGTPGRCCDWNCASNWKEERVPDEFSNVVIPDVSTQTFCYPVIFAGKTEVLSVELHPGCAIEIFKDARLYTESFQAQGKNKCIGCEQGLYVGGLSSSSNVNLMVKNQ